MSLNCWLLPASGWLIFPPQWAPFQKNLNLEAKTDTLSALGWKEECQQDITDGGWHQLLGSSTSCFMLQGPRMNWQCPSQQTLLARFLTVTPVRDLDYLASSTVAQPGCQPCGIKHTTRTLPPLTPSAAYILYLLLCKIIASGLQVKIHLLAVLFHCCPAVWFSVNLFPIFPFPWLWLHTLWCRLHFSMKLHSVEPKTGPSSELNLQRMRQIHIASCFPHSRYKFALHHPFHNNSQKSTFWRQSMKFTGSRLKSWMAK